MNMGFDYDGVVTNAAFWKSIESERFANSYFVVSGRTFHEEPFNGSLLTGLVQGAIRRGYGEFGDQIASGHYKAEIINKLRIQVFYDDDPKQLLVIKQSLTWPPSLYLVMPDGKTERY